MHRPWFELWHVSIGAPVQLRKAIEDVIRKNYDDLYQLLRSEATLQQLANSLHQEGIVPREVVRSPTYNGIMDSFTSPLPVLGNVEDIEAHCRVLTKALDKLGTTGLRTCSQKLASEWREAANKNGYNDFLQTINSKTIAIRLTYVYFLQYLPHKDNLKLHPSWTSLQYIYIL